jgi:prepilin-type processing-associated H-X9-DG protein
MHRRSKSKGPSGSRAFTLVELAVMIVIVAVLGSVMLPAFAKTGLNSRSVQCLNNNRQLCAAWRMYADDSRDRIVYAGEDGTGTSNPLNQYAWTAANMDFNSGNRQNWDPTVDLMKRPLWPYTGRNAAIYKCPSDQSVVVVNGVAKPRLRSMSMNLYLGGFAGTDGGWPFAEPYRIFVKTTELTAPGPAKTFVFLDQRWDQINWGNFMTDMSGYPNSPAQYKFQDLPNMLHNLGCGFSFADGHTELHRWLDPRTTPPLSSYIGGDPVSQPLNTPNNPDVAWLQAHATAPK